MTGYEQTGRIDPADAASALMAVLPALEPIHPVKLARAIGECFVATKARNTGEDDLKLFASVLTKGLAEFPEDVVLTAFERWCRREVFRPSLAEIRQSCWELCKGRRSLAHRLRNPGMSRRQEAPKGKDWAMMTQDERDEMDARIKACRGKLLTGGPKPIKAVIPATLKPLHVPMPRPAGFYGEKGAGA